MNINSQKPISVCIKCFCVGTEYQKAPPLVHALTLPVLQGLRRGIFLTVTVSVVTYTTVMLEQLLLALRNLDPCIWAGVFQPHTGFHIAPSMAIC